MKVLARIPNKITFRKRNARAGEGQIVIKVEAVGVCQTDLDVLEGKEGKRTGALRVLGHEIRALFMKQARCENVKTGQSIVVTGMSQENAYCKKGILGWSTDGLQGSTDGECRNTCVSLECRSRS